MNRDIKMAVTEMCVCFEATLLQHSSTKQPGRAGSSWRLPFPTGGGTHTISGSFGVKCQHEVRFVLYLCLSTLCSCKSCRRLWPQPLEALVKQ